MKNISFIGSKTEYEEFAQSFQTLKSSQSIISFDDGPTRYRLQYIENKLSLIDTETTLSICVDFSSSDIQNRIDTHTAKLPLIKAIEGKHKNKLTVIDATAGLGTDSFCIAAREHKVIAIEQSPIVYSLLFDGIKRAQKDINLTSIANKIRLTFGNASEVIPRLPATDLIYLDPMFPDKAKSAKVKKNMQMLQIILGKNNDNSCLFQTAVSHAAKKVIVKRPKQSPFLGDTKPNSQLIGKTNRFDVYVI
jgi:16S rRNA (guanine1516-N2)-methyltransferase